MQREESGSLSNRPLPSPQGCSQSKQERLRGGSIRRIRWTATGETVHFLLFVSHEEGTRRVCVTVPKRIGNAVLRNRIRRVIKEFFRLNKHLFPQSKDFRILVKKRPPLLHFHALASELSQLVSPRQI